MLQESQADIGAATESAAAYSPSQRAVRRVLCLTREVKRSHGWGRVAFELMREMQAAGLQISVFTQAGADNDSLPDLEFNRALISTGFGALKPARAMADALSLKGAAAKSDVILALDEPSALAAAYASRLSGKPFACVLHGTFAITSLKGWRGLLHRPAFDRAGRLIFVSGYTRRRFLESFGEVRAASCVASLGVDQALIVSAPPPLALRAREILTVGEVKPRKGLMQMVEAVALIAPGLRPAILVAGNCDAEPDFVEAVKLRAAQLGVEKGLHFLGRVSHDELEALYRRVRVFVLPSQNVGDDFEGFGLVHLEAAARGLPAIGSEECGNEDAILDGRTGYLVAQDDQATLAKRIDALMNDDDLWRACSANSLDFARSMTWRNTSASVLRALNAMV